MQTKVSMVIPCYNKVKYIDEMFQSVYDQHYDNIELVIVNDGSTDGTRERITEWVPKFEQRGFEVHVIDQDNKGVGAAVRVGLENITGEYVCMPDCDDIIMPEYASAMARELDDDSKLNLVWCNVNPKLMETKITNDNLLLLLLLHERARYSVCVGMFRTDIISKSGMLEKYIDSRISQEPQVNIPLCLYCGVPKLLGEKLYIYRQIENSIRESVINDYQKSVDYWNAYKELALNILRRYDALNGKTEFVIGIAIDMCIYADTESDRFKKDIAFRLMKGLSDVLRMDIGTIFKQHNITRKNLLCLYYLYGETFAVSQNKYFQKINTFMKGKRIVACASNGKVAGRMLPVMEKFGLKPDLLWDAKCGYDCDYSRRKVTLPRYDELSQNDIVIILSSLPEVEFEIRTRVMGCCCFGLDDVVSMIFAKIYEQIHKKWEES